MICKNCKKSNDDNATFCRFCGSSLKNNNIETDYKSDECTDSNGIPLRCRCGNHLKYNDTECSKCHRKFYIQVKRSNDIIISEPRIFYKNDQYLFLVLFIICTALAYFVHPAYAFGSLVAISAGVVCCPKSLLLKAIFLASIAFIFGYLFIIFYTFKSCIWVFFFCPFLWA